MKFAMKHGVANLQAQAVAGFGLGFKGDMGRAKIGRVFAFKARLAIVAVFPLAAFFVAPFAIALATVGIAA